MTRSRHLLLLSLVLLAPAVGVPAASAQEYGTWEKPIQTGRPDFAPSAQTVPAGRLQLEAGVEYWDTGQEELVALPNLLARFGVLSFAEARLRVPDLRITNLSGDAEVEPGHLGVSAKFIAQLGKQLSLGVIPFVDFPMTDDAPGFRVGGVALAGLSVSPVTLVGSASFTGIEAAGDDWFLEVTTNLSVEYQVAAWLVPFVEGHLVFPDQGSNQYYVDGGFLIRATPRLQLDVMGGVEVSEAEAFLVRAGVAYVF